MHRPLGVSILAILLLVLAIAGLGNTYVMATQPGYGGRLLAAVALVYGVTALASAVGLWRRRRWAYSAFLAWGTTILVGAIAFQVLVAQQPWLKLLVFLLVAGVVLHALARYVRKVSTPSTR